MENPYTSNLAVDLNRISYDEAFALQKECIEKVRSNVYSRILLFLTHEPVYTVGRKFDVNNFGSIDVVKTDRGGDVTYHGPGQLVIYPIFHIGDPSRIDVRKFVTSIEQTIMNALSYLGVHSFVGEEPGIWIEVDGSKKKVASIGMAIDQGISYHGISINLSSEVLEGFNKIRPCGMDPEVMGYIDASREEMISALLRSFNESFGEFQFIEVDKFKNMVQQISLK
ncbi:MAG: lipoyl(octanoyl) transferase LipB [Thermoplasmatales archaeon]|nr:lipoyl(octanoyl) transferase LipB [Thermoplasmatales archaeon]